MHDLGQSLWLDNDEVLARFAAAAIDVQVLAARLQDEGAETFVKSWNDMMGVITSESAVLKRAS